MEKILPFCNKPSITHAPLDTYVLSILESDQCRYTNWIMTSYLNVKFNSDDYTHDTFCPSDLLLQCPYISYETTPYKNLMATNIQFSDFCKQNIDNNRYIYGHLNKKYISYYNCNIDDDHNLIIFGYSEKDVFAADFFNFTYSVKVIPVENLNNAFVYLRQVNHFGVANCYLNENIMYYTLDLRYRKTIFDKIEYCIYQIKKQTQDFLNSTYVSIEKGNIYGVNCFASCDNIDLITVRQLSIFNSICKMWQNRIGFLFKNNVISSSSFEKLNSTINLCVKQSKINLILLIKYCLLKEKGQKLIGYSKKILEGIAQNKLLLVSFCEDLLHYI